jgi:hypothetical protein
MGPANSFVKLAFPAIGSAARHPLSPDRDGESRRSRDPSLAEPMPVIISLGETRKRYARAGVPVPADGIPAVRVLQGQRLHRSPALPGADARVLPLRHSADAAVRGGGVRIAMDRLERRRPSTASSRPPLPPERLQTIHPGARGGSFHSFPMVKDAPSSHRMA